MDSRATSDGIRRRRVCAECKRRFTTYERLAPPGIKVTKRDGRTEPFDSGKLMRVLGRVCRGRKNLDTAAQERVARSIEAQLLDEQVKSISSTEIIQRVLSKLADLDRVAYDRLAADYVDEDGNLRIAPPGDDDDDDGGQLGLFPDDDRD